MKEIPLTHGLFAIVDDEDFPRIEAYKWHATLITPRNRSHYARRSDKNKWPFMHREILGVSDCRQVDHVNGNGLDNRRANLRIATLSQNQGNRQIGCNNTSGFKGVVWHKSARKWQAQLRASGSCIYLGLFVDKLDAVEAYKVAAIKYFGEFAKI